VTAKELTETNISAGNLSTELKGGLNRKYNSKAEVAKLKDFFPHELKVIKDKQIKGQRVAMNLFV
jgi:hypothetical protein